MNWNFLNYFKRIIFSRKSFFEVHYFRKFNLAKNSHLYQDHFSQHCFESFYLNYPSFQFDEKKIRKNAITQLVAQCITCCNTFHWGLVRPSALSLSLSLSFTHTLTLSLSILHTHTHTLSLSFFFSLSLSDAHTFTVSIYLGINSAFFRFHLNISNSYF